MNKLFVVLCHCQHQGLYLRGDWRSSVLLAVPCSIEFLCYQSSVPLQDRFGPDDGYGVSHQLAQGNGFLGEDPAFGVGEQNAFLDLVA